MGRWYCYIPDTALRDERLRRIPLGRAGTTTDIAYGVLYLASEESSYVTGQTVVVDGGQTLGIPGDLGDAAEATSGESPK